MNPLPFVDVLFSLHVLIAQWVTSSHHTSSISIMLILPASLPPLPHIHNACILVSFPCHRRPIWVTEIRSHTNISTSCFPIGFLVPRILLGLQDFLFENKMHRSDHLVMYVLKCLSK